MKCKALAKSGNHFSPFQRGCQKLIKTRIPEISRFGLLETSPKKLLKLLFVLFSFVGSPPYSLVDRQPRRFFQSDFALFQLVGWRRQTGQRARQKLQHDQPDALSGGLHSLRLSKDTGGTGTGRRPAKVGTSQTTGYPMTTPMLGFTPNYGQITNTFLGNKSPIKAPHLLGQIRSN